MPTPATIGQVWAEVATEQPLDEGILMALNHEYVQADQNVADGDEVAFSASDWRLIVNELTHANAAGEAHMVDVGGKPETHQIAVARGSIHMQTDVDAH